MRLVTPVQIRQKPLSERLSSASRKGFPNLPKVRLDFPSGARSLPARTLLGQASERYSGPDPSERRLRGTPEAFGLVTRKAAV